MDKKAMEIFRKNFWFVSVGAALQMLGGIFLFAGAVRTIRDVHSLVMAALKRGLSGEE